MVIPVLGAEPLAKLHDRFQEYSQGGHYRANALVIRSRAHALIRDLTAPNNLPKLSLDDFDEHVWRLGNMGMRRESFDWHHAERVLAETSPDRFAKLLDSGEMGFVGNMTWGSATKTLRAYAHGRSSDELEAQMRRALTLLLHQPGPIENRLRQAKDLGIGFGRNICSGLLMAWQPQEFILYNSRSEDCWAALGLDFEAGINWVKPYLRYNAFCQTLLDDPVLKLQNLVELDIFVYWHTVQHPPPPREKTAPTRRKRGRPPKALQAGITLEQLRVTKQEMSPESFQPTWGELYDRLMTEELSRPTTDVTAAELGRRARRRLDEIHAFLQGKNTSSPSAEVVCDWIHFCYALDLYREAAGLLPYIRGDEVDPAIYKRARRVAEVCRSKLTG
jgi:hypothetical protein